MVYKAPQWDEDPEILVLWQSEHPDRKLPGMPAPKEGYCSAQLRDKELKELGITRYCSKNAGYGTGTHVGYGNCKYHGGKTPNGKTSGERAMIKQESTAMALRLGSPDPIAPPEVEVLRLAGELKEWTTIMRERISELSSLETTDQAGVEHARATVELYERALDRYSELIQFMIKIGVRERVVAIQEQQGQALAALVLALITSPKLNLTLPQIDLARSMFAEKARAMGSRLSPDWAESLEYSLGDVMNNDDDIIDADVL